MSLGLCIISSWKVDCGFELHGDIFLEVLSLARPDLEEANWSG